MTIDLTRNCERIVVGGFQSDSLGRQFSESQEGYHPDRRILELMDQDLPAIHQVIAQECSNVPKWIEIVWRKLDLLKEPFTVYTVQEVIQDLINSQDQFSLNQYEDRLDGYASEFGENPLKEPILYELCKYREGAPKENIRAVIGQLSDFRDDLFRDAINELKDDHYVKQTGDKISFSMELLRRFWEARS